MTAQPCVTARSLFKPVRESISTAQQRIADEFALFDDFNDRYEHLKSLAHRLEPMAEDQKVDGNHLRDCRGEAWLTGGYRNGRLYLSGFSHSDMIAGLLAIVIDIYSGHTPETILANPLDAQTLGLTSCLSPHRLSCFHGILQRVRNLAMLAKVQGCA